MKYKNRVYNMKQKLKNIEAEINNKKNINNNMKKLEYMLNQPYSHMEIKHLLAKCYVEVGRTDEALALYDFLYECNKSGELLIDIVHLLMNIGEVDKARVYIDQAEFSVEKSFIEGVYNKRMGNYNEAINIFNTLKHTVMEEDMYIELATTYSLMGNREKEKEIYYKLINTAKRYQALSYLIKIAFGENDPNVENLLKMFDIDKCYHRGDILRFKRCLLFYQYLKGELNEEQDSYLGKQLYNYDIKKAINHVKYKHQFNGMIYRFLDSINLEDVFNYCSNHLEVLLFKEEKDHYLVEMPYDVGYFNNLKTNLMEVITIPNTNNILTMYPIPKVGRYNFDKIKERNQGNAKQ